ncbi:MAG: YdeI/OmpD-associated family protein [Actinomycetes bacterium]
MRFQARVELGGKNATGIVVPDKVIESLAAGKKPAVVVTVDGYSYRSTVFSRDGRYLIPLSAAHRAGAGLAAGDPVEVDLQVDTAPREVEVPDDLAAALQAAPSARRAFDALSYTNKRRYVLSIEDAKTDATRQRRISKTVDELGTA